MRSEIAQIIRQDQVMELVYGNSDHPKNLLGRHILENGQVISAYHPDAVSMRLIDEEGRIHEMNSVERHPIYAIFFPSRKKFSYEIEMTFRDGNRYRSPDPYSFSSQITEEEQQLFLDGKWMNCYEKLGAHPMTIRGVEGIYFAVWAPNARRVSVIGNFNFWNGMMYPMQKLGDSGIFELFLPKVATKSLYRYEIKTKDGAILQRMDPFGRVDLDGEDNTSIILDVKDFAWTDHQWMRDRRHKKWGEAPFSICDMEFLDTFQKEFLERKTFTHVLLQKPMFGHSVRGQIREWINSLHEKGIGVVLKVSLGLYSPEDNGLDNYDGTALFGYRDQKLQVDDETNMLRFFHGRKEVSSYLISNLLFWMREYHIDGFVFSGISEMVNVSYYNEDDEKKVRYQKAAEEFICRAAKAVKKEDFSTFLIADEKEELEKQIRELIFSRAEFDALINHSIPTSFTDYVKTAVEHPNRKYYKLSLPLMKTGIENSFIDVALDPGAFGKEKYMDRIFMNEHDRLSWKKLIMGYLIAVPGKKRWSWNEVESTNLWTYMLKIFELYSTHSCMYTYEPKKPSFVWMNGMDAENSVLTFVRRSVGRDKNLLFVFNFSRSRKESFCIGVPKYGEYRLVLNSDWDEFGGSLRADDIVMGSISQECDLQPYSLRVTMTGLSVLVFEY